MLIDAVKRVVRMLETTDLDSLLVRFSLADEWIEVRIAEDYVTLSCEACGAKYQISSDVQPDVLELFIASTLLKLVSKIMVSEWDDRLSIAPLPGLECNLPGFGAEGMKTLWGSFRENLGLDFLVSDLNEDGFVVCYLRMGDKLTVYGVRFLRMEDTVYTCLVACEGSNFECLDGNTMSPLRLGNCSSDSEVFEVAKDRLNEYLLRR